MIDRALAGLCILCIRIYQWTVAPLLPRSCRFAPSCSEYAAEALARHGILGGSWLALRRILRCHPWGGSGYDPVPEAHQGPCRPAGPCAHSAR